MPVPIELVAGFCTPLRLANFAVALFCSFIIIGKYRTAIKLFPFAIYAIAIEAFSYGTFIERSKRQFGDGDIARYYPLNNDSLSVLRDFIKESPDNRWVLDNAVVINYYYFAGLAGYVFWLISYLMSRSKYCSWSINDRKWKRYMKTYVVTSSMYSLSVFMAWISMIIILFGFTNVSKQIIITYNQQSAEQIIHACLYSLCLVGFVENVIPMYITALRNSFVRQTLQHTNLI